MPVQITAWSHSRLEVYKKCPYQAKLKYIDKIPELPRPAPPNGKEHANDRGSRVHQACEDFVTGKISKQIPEMLCFEREFNKLRAMRKAAKSSIICEQTWALDSAWKFIDPSRYKDIWGRLIIDAVAFLSPREAIVIDYKTGKRHGNELKHAEQTQLYQLAGFLRFPALEVIHTELWYLDQDEIAGQTYRRDQGLRFFKKFNDDALKMTSATAFPTHPSIHSCRFCPYQTGENKWLTGTGDCEENPT